LSLPAPEVTPNAIIGEVIHVDRFGNLITNIDHKLFDKFSQSAGIEVLAGSHRINRVVATYADAAGGEPCALFGSTDHLEIAVNAASAAERLSLTRGAKVTIRKT
jgi:S-adenosylmethionine hydrolase